MKPQILQRSSVRFALWGALFGAAFPAVAFLLVLVFNAKINLLLGIIATAPIMLGLFASFAGIRQDRLNDVNVNLESLVQERTNSLQSLLDVTGEGYLSFGPDYLIRPEYSQACELIFGGPIGGKRLPDLLYVEDGKKQDFTDGLGLFFSGKAKPEVIFDLLDEEVEIGEKTVQIDYRAIDDASVMCSLRDVTGQRALESEVAEQERRRSLILRVASHRQYFSAFVDEADELIDYLDAHHSSPPPTDEHESVYQTLVQKLHTFKSNAGFLGFARTETVSHDMEDRLSDQLILGEEIELASDIIVLKRQYFDELAVVSQTLGKAWIGNLGAVSVQARSIQRVEQYVRSQHAEDKKLVAAIEGFRRVRLGALFSRFSDVAADLAGRRGKRLKPLIITGGDVQVLPERYEPLVNELIHILRNMVDHGIESPAERELRGKDPAGQLTVQIRHDPAHVVITMADDGGGISLAAVEARARARKLLGSEEKTTRERLLALIFEPGFSTTDQVTTISGRGVGLSAVRSAVKSFGGKIAIQTNAGKGTTFRITVPLR